MLLAQGSKSGAWYLHLNNPTDICQRIGSRVFGAFLRCFVGVDRCASIVHLLHLNEEHGGSEDSHVRGRNFWLLLLFMAGTMNEVGEALQALAASKVLAKMGNRSKWDVLDGIRRRWNTNPVASKVRNQLSHHLGDPAVYEKGIESLCKKRRLQFYCSDGMKIGEGMYEGAWNAITNGLDLELQDYQQLCGQMGIDVALLHKALLEVFLDVVDAAGIPKKDERR